MRLSDLTYWLDKLYKPDCVWFAKRLSGDDTLANGSRSAGPRIPRQYLFHALPSLKQSDARDQDIWFELRVDSHDPESRRVLAIRDKHRSGDKESLIINFDDAQSALLDPENTGALTIFVFKRDEPQAATNVRIWVCRNEAEEELLEYWIGPVEPGQWIMRSESQGLLYGP